MRSLAMEFFDREKQQKTLSAWYVIRDKFLGQNGEPLDVLGALELAKSCEHPDATLLHQMFAGKTLVTTRDVMTVLEENFHDVRAKLFYSFFAEHLTFRDRTEMVKEAAGEVREGHVPSFFYC